MRHAIAIAVLVLLPLGCREQEMGSKRAATTHAALSKDDQVRLVAFRELLDLYETNHQEPDPARLNAFYISVGPAIKDKEPSDALMQAIGKRKLPIFKVSRCMRWNSGLDNQNRNFGWGQCVDRKTLKPGYILWVGPMKWIDANTAKFEAGHWEHAMGASGDSMRASLVHGKWVLEYTGSHWVH